MNKGYPPSYEQFYSDLSITTGMTKQEIHVFILRLIKLLKRDLNHDGEVCLPYLGKFFLKRMPPRKRAIRDFGTNEVFTVNIPAMDKLRFIVNKNFSKLFR